MIEEVERIRGEEGKCVFYQLHVGALVEVTFGFAALRVPRQLGHQPVPLQGAIKQKAVKAWQG